MKKSAYDAHLLTTQEQHDRVLDSYKRMKKHTHECFLDLKRLRKLLEAEKKQKPK